MSLVDDINKALGENHAGIQHRRITLKSQHGLGSASCEEGIFESIRKHRRWLTMLSATGVLGMGIKSSFLYDRFLETKNFREVQQVHALIQESRPRINNLFHIDSDGSCSLYVQGQNSLKDCAYSGRITQGLYPLTDVSGMSVSFAQGTIHSSWPINNNYSSMVFVNGETNNFVGDFLPSNQQNNNQDITLTKTSENTQQSRRVQQQITRPVSRAAITQCTRNYFVKPRERFSDVGGCIAFTDDSRICNTQQVGRNSLFYVRSNGEVFRDLGADGILGWQASSRLQGEVTKNNLLNRTFHRFSARNNSSMQNSYARKIQRINVYAQEHYGSTCQDRRAQNTITANTHNTQQEQQRSTLRREPNSGPRPILREFPLSLQEQIQTDEVTLYVPRSAIRRNTDFRSRRSCPYIVSYEGERYCVSNRP